MFIYSLNHLCIAGRFCKRNLNSALPWTQRIPQAVFVHKSGFLFEEWFDVIFVFHEAYYCACTICKYPGLCFLLLKWENCAVICASLTAWFPTTVMFFERKSRHVGSNIFFMVFHQNLPPFTTSPSCLSWSKCIYWIPSQDPVNHLFQCPTFIEFRMTRSSWKPSDLTALFHRWALRAGRRDPFPTCPELAVTEMSTCVSLVWVSWWDCVLGIQDGLMTDWLLKIPTKKVTWMKQQTV